MGIRIIAEAGVNHNGDCTIAKQLIDAAADAGADIVKFQTFRAKDLATKNAKKAEYQQVNDGKNNSQTEMLSRLELNKEQHEVLINHCKKRGIQFLSAPFDFFSIDLLSGFHLPFYKIPSGEITNLPYLIKIAQLKKPIILSSGMSTMDELKAAIKILRQHGGDDITALHCTTEYPAPYEDVNLNAMLTMKKELNIPVGYSDHTPGIEISIAAAALGAVVIEKHFTLDRTMEGPDHKASLEPEQLKSMINSIRNVEKALGDGIKKPSASEIKNIAIARKSIVANRMIKKGEPFTEENIITKRPGNGLSPMRWFEVLGKTAKRNFMEDELIEL